MSEIMSNYLQQETIRVAVGPWYPVKISRPTERWGLGYEEYEDGAEKHSSNPEQARMGKADRPTGLIMARTVEVVDTGQGQH